MLTSRWSGRFAAVAVIAGAMTLAPGSTALADDVVSVPMSTSYAYVDCNINTLPDPGHTWWYFYAAGSSKFVTVSIDFNTSGGVVTVELPKVTDDPSWEGAITPDERQLTIVTEEGWTPVDGTAQITNGDESDTVFYQGRYCTVPSGETTPSASPTATSPATPTTPTASASPTASTTPSPQSSPGTPTPTPSPSATSTAPDDDSDALPTTGAPIVWIVVTGALLGVVGAAALVAGRRRRSWRIG